MTRPLYVTLVSFVFILAGVVGIIYHAKELKDIFANQDVVVVFLVRILAIIGGLFALKGRNWARWLLSAWMAYHVILSFYHTTAEVAMHIVIMVIVIVALFNKAANAYFRMR